MPKILTNSRDNFISIYGLVDRHESWLDQSLTVDSSPTFTNLTLTGDAQINGNLNVTGNTTILGTDILLIKDNIIEINTPEEGSGVSLGVAGIQIERGSFVDYQIVFRESDDSVVIGEIGNLQVLATRQDNPLSDGVMVYNSLEKRLDSVDDITIPITLSSNETSTTPTSGSLRTAGGIGIYNTTDASSITNGGTFTTSGGASIGKKLFVGNTSDFLNNIIVSSSDYNGSNIENHGVLVGGNTFTDDITSSSGTAISNNLVNLKRTTLGASNTSVTTTDSSTLYIEGEPIQGTNQTLTNTYSLLVGSGKTKFQGDVDITNDLLVYGDFTVKGISTTVNSTVVSIQDNAFVVNSLPSSLSDGGVLVKRYQMPDNSGIQGEVIKDSVDQSSTFDPGSSIPDILVLNNTSSSTNNFYRGWWIKITSGSGINQVRRIKSYDGATKTATIYSTSDNTDNFLDGLDLTVAPNAGDSYNLYSGTYSGVFYDDTNDEWALGKIPYDTGAGTFPLVDYQDLHVKTLTASGITGFISSPTFSATNLINIGSILLENISMISTEPDRTYSGCLRIEPFLGLFDTSFEFPLPDVSTNWSNPYDISVVFNGYYNFTNFYSIENIVGYAVPGTTRMKLKFTSNDTSQHIIQFIVRYKIV